MLTIIQNAIIITVDEKKRILRDSAIVLEEDKIKWIGLTKDLPDFGRNSTVIDAANKVIFPGFVNIHTHAALSVLRGIGDDRGIAPAYSPSVPQGVFLSPNDCYVFSLLGGLEALKFGTTCIVDNYIHEQQAVKAFDQLGMRAVVSERLHDADLFAIPEGKYEFDRQRGRDLLEAGLQLIRDWQGASEGRITCRLGPHASDTCSTEYLKEIKKAAEETQVGLVIHLAQSKREIAQIQERSGLSPTKFLDSLGLLTSQMIAGHCVYVDDNDIQILAKSGTHVSHQSGSNAKNAMMAPIKAIRQQGINVGLGTDNMAGDMVEVMRLALTVARMQTGDHLAFQALDVLEMATNGGALALGLHNSIGSLEVGKKADLVVVDFLKPHLIPLVDPVANFVHNGLGSDVDMVFVNGKLLIKEGKSTQIDEISVMQEAQKCSNFLWKKFKDG